MLFRSIGTIGTLPASLPLICFIGGVTAIVMGKDHTYAVINLKTGQIRKIPQDRVVYRVVPYMSFYTPGTNLPSFGYVNIHNHQYFFC